MSPLIQRKFKPDHLIATLIIAGKSFRTFASPLNGTAKLSAGPYNESKFGIESVPGAVITPNIPRHHANVFGLYTENSRKFVTVLLHPTASSMERVFAGRRIIHPQGSPGI